MMTTQTTELTDTERAQFVMLETRIKEGLTIFYRVGDALLIIRDKRLYRDDFPSFEAYCIERWNMGRRYANMLIAAAGVYENLEQGTIVPLPMHETHVRPLVSLEPIAQRIVYEVASQTAPNGHMTEAHVKSVVNVFKEVVTTGAVDNGTGEQIKVSQVIDAAITEETYERMMRQKSHIADSAANGKPKPLINDVMTVEDAIRELEYLDATRKVKVIVKDVL